MSAALHQLIEQRQDLVDGARHLREGHFMLDSSAYGEALHGIDRFDEVHLADPVYAEWLPLHHALQAVLLARELRAGDYDLARLQSAQSAMDRFMAEHPAASDDKPEDPQVNPSPTL